jgi:sulfatase maturation enzyme AslB (radical SAM superfamily)
MGSLEIRQYESFEVSFMTGARNVKVNATEMAKIYGKETRVFMKTDGLKSFINSLISSPKSAQIGIKTKEDILQDKGRNGLWMHRILALKFAAWLNSDFEVWVYHTIDEILFGQLPELAQKKIKVIDEVEQAELALYNTQEYKDYELAKAKQKTINKAIRTQQDNQLTLFIK